MEQMNQNPNQVPPPPSYQTPPPDRRLYRSRRNRVIGGVAGGLADYFGIDPTVVRLIWAFTIFFAGFGFFAYIVAWIVIPEEPTR